MKIETPKTDASEYASAKVQPSRMAVYAAQRVVQNAMNQSGGMTQLFEREHQ